MTKFKLINGTGEFTVELANAKTATLRFTPGLVCLETTETVLLRTSESVDLVAGKFVVVTAGEGVAVKSGSKFGQDAATLLSATAPQTFDGLVRHMQKPN